MVRSRFAPSPTGSLHIGSLRTALYAYALARHSDGRFILRIEDTDQKREVAGSAEALQVTLRKFGLEWDEFFVQSHRAKEGLYRDAAAKLVAAGRAFYCQCPPKNAKDDGYSTQLRDPCRDQAYTSGAVKLKVPPNRQLSYHDFVHRKTISWNTDTVYDATLIKSDGFPTYHLAAMVDDLDMRITHILRGHDWLPSTPIHLLVFEFLGGTPPQIGHLTDILSADTGKKLSKRRDSVICESFLDSGYLPEALLNQVMLLGWAPKDNSELFTLSEFVAKFDPSGFQEANPRFLTAKLDWFNAHYIRAKTDTELTHLVKPFMKTNWSASDTLITQIVALLKDRLVKLSDFTSLSSFFFARPSVDPGLFPSSDASAHLDLALSHFSAAAAWSKIDLESGLTDKIKARGWKVGDFFMTLRIAVCGSRFTPPLTESLVILGRAESLARLEQVRQKLLH